MVDGRATSNRGRPCGCRFEEAGDCTCDVTCAYCWPDFTEEQHEAALWESTLMDGLEDD